MRFRAGLVLLLAICAVSFGAITEEARIAGVRASVLVFLDVDADGALRSAEVKSPAGFGLDEEAVATVRTGHYGPGEVAVQVGFVAEARPGAPKAQLTFQGIAGHRPVLVAGEEVPLFEDPAIETALVKFHVAESGAVDQVQALVLKKLRSIPNALPAQAAEVQAFQRLLSWRFSPSAAGRDAVLHLDYRRRP